MRVGIFCLTLICQYSQAFGQTQINSNGDNIAHDKITNNNYVLLDSNTSELRNSRSERSIREIGDLVTQWYNQLYTLNVNSKFSKDSVNLEKDVFFYNQNRIVLPKLLLNFESIKNIRRCDSLLKYTKDFLNVLTNYKDPLDPSMLKCNEVLLSRNQLILEKNITPLKLDAILLKLDPLIQAINVEVGRLLQ